MYLTFGSFLICKPISLITYISSATLWDEYYNLHFRKSVIDELLNVKEASTLVGLKFKLTLSIQGQCAFHYINNTFLSTNKQHHTLTILFLSSSWKQL